MLVGLDEAGVGALVGPLVAAAVGFAADAPAIEGLADSKKLSAKRREALAREVREHACFGVGVVAHTEVDALGMARCRRLVFERALDDLVARGYPQPASLVIDGTLFDGWRDVPFECVPRADASVREVSAASIVAKTFRDDAMRRLCAEAPEAAARYGWGTNMGYPSAMHREAILMHGRTPHHRHTFRLRDEPVVFR